MTTPEERIAALETDLTNVREALAEVRTDVRAIREAISQTRGGWKVIVTLVTASGLGGFVAGKLSALFGMLPH